MKPLSHKELASLAAYTGKEMRALEHDAAKLKPVVNFNGELQFFRWPKGVKKIICEGFTITRMEPMKKRKEKR